MHVGGLASTGAQRSDGKVDEQHAQHLGAVLRDVRQHGARLVALVLLAVCVGGGVDVEAKDRVLSARAALRCLHEEERQALEAARVLEEAKKRKYKENT